MSAKHTPADLAAAIKFLERVRTREISGWSTAPASADEKRILRGAEAVLNAAYRRAVDPVGDGGPAFPQTMVVGQNGGMTCAWDGYGMGGASLRDWFAAHAPRHVVDVEDWSVTNCEKALGLTQGEYDWRAHHVMLVAKLSYEYADAMLRARAAS